MVWLGLTLGLRSGIHQRRSLLLWGSSLIAGFIAACLLLILPAAQGVVRAEAARLEALGQADRDLGTAPGVAVVEYPLADGSIDVVIGSPAAIAALPGAAEHEGSGRVSFSPALARMVEEKPGVRALFPAERGPDLAPEAVASAGDLRAYLVVDPATSIERVGALAIDLDVRNELGAYAWVGFVTFTVLPAVGLLAVAGSIGRTARRQRYAGLRLLGMGGGSVRAGMALDAAVPASIGTLIALVLQAGTPSGPIRVPIVGRWVFGTDLGLRWGDRILVLLAVASVMAIAGASVGRSQGRTGSRSRVASVDPASSWAALVYVGGLVLAGLALAEPRPNDPKRLQAVVLSSLGMLGAVRLVLRTTARLVGRRPRHVATLLGARRSAASPIRSSRFAGIVGIVALAAMLASPVAATIGTSLELLPDDRADAPTLIGDVRSQARLGSRSPDPDPPAAVSTVVYGGEVEIVEPAQGAPVPAFAIVADCAQLAAVVGAEPTDCRGEPLLLAQNGPGRLRGTYRVLDPAGQPVATVEVDGGPIGLRGQPRGPIGADPSAEVLVIPPGTVEPTALAPRLIAFDRNERDYLATAAWLLQTDPSARIDLTSSVAIGLVPDATGGWVLIGILVSAVTALLAAAMSLLAAADDHRILRPLRLLGVSTGTILRSSVVEGACAAAATLALVLLPAAVITASFLQLDLGDVAVDVRGWFAAVGAVAVAVIIASALVAASVQLREDGRHGS